MPERDSTYHKYNIGLAPEITEALLYGVFDTCLEQCPRFLQIAGLIQVERAFRQKGERSNYGELVRRLSEQSRLASGRQRYEGEVCKGPAEDRNCPVSPLSPIELAKFVKWRDAGT